MSDASWYATVDGVEQGPMTVAELKALAVADRVGPETPIRREGMAHTVPAARVKGLLPLVNVQPPTKARPPVQLTPAAEDQPLFAPDPPPRAAFVPRPSPSRPTPPNPRLAADADNPFAAPDADLPMHREQREGIVPAGIGRRFAGMLIDGVLNLLIVMAIVFAVVASTVSQGSLVDDDPQTGLVLIICVYLFACPYWIICEGLWGATPGKLMLRMRVTDRSGAPIGFGRAIGRNLMRSIFLYVVPFGGIIDAVFAMMDDDRRSLHDRVAATYVIHLDATPVRRRGTGTINRPRYRRS